LTQIIRQLPQDPAKITEENFRFSENFVTESISLNTQQMTGILRTIVQRATDVCNDQISRPPIALSDAAFSLVPTVLEEYFQKQPMGDVQFEPFDALLSRLVAPDLGAVDPQKIEPLLDQFKSTLQAQDFKKAGAYLFLLLNHELSFEKTIELLQPLEQSSTREEPIVKSGVALLTQKLYLQKERFNTQWDATLQRARIFDQFRKQLEQDNPASIEKMLCQIADLADLLSFDEKITVLNKMIAILSKEGCFSSLYDLQLLQLQVIKKLGVFEPPLNPMKNAYNSAFTLIFENIDTNKTPLPALFMQIVQNFNCTETYLIPAWIAINHLEWDPKDLISLYCWIEAWNGADKAKRTLKKQCLARIRELLIEHLQ
ncbi:MAG: hypothetical protein JSR46_09820, partial [Verrucomicrobia bacterium]|nr:hypothetical protein [Verrucomicrobiota bacterium]